MVKREAEKETQEDLKQVFRVFDKVLMTSPPCQVLSILPQDGNGFVSTSEIKFVLSKWEPKSAKKYKPWFPMWATQCPGLGWTLATMSCRRWCRWKNNYHLHLTCRWKKTKLSLVLKLRKSQTNNMNYKWWLQIIIFITRRPILTATSMWALRSSATSSMKDKFQVIVFYECLTELNNSWFQFHQILNILTGIGGEGV